MLTLNEFRASAQYYTPNGKKGQTTKDACDLLAVPPDYVQYADGKPFTEIVIFDDGSGWMSQEWSNGKMNPPRYHANISASEFYGLWDDVSACVYFEHYVSEHVDVDDLDEATLCTLLEDFCRWQGWPYGCAMELLHAVRDMGVRATYGFNNAARWLEWFIERWDHYQENRDDIVVAGRQYWVVNHTPTGRAFADGPVTPIKQLSNGWLVEWTDETRTIEMIDSDDTDFDTCQRACDGYNSRA